MKIQDFKRKKEEQQKIVMVTCYDYPSACIVSESNVDCVLVGDSVAMAVHGHETTIMATIEMMVLHTQAVARGLKQQFLISDLPFLSHKTSLAQTVENVKSLLRSGTHAVKIEGADADTCQTISYLVGAGVPVMGHIGLTPQSIHQLGGYKVQGRNPDQAEILIQQALSLEAAGCFALVIECVPQSLAQAITQSLRIPTIGIGAGSDTDGQVLVWHDMLGLQTDFNPKFVKRYLQGKEMMLSALNAYAQQVRQASFPTSEHAF
ncbi:3-methyl-2-oxobutanoate hydroxymethyltransferase [Legionella longbeachae]|uniref:3-methyl-2-oxobutanoate hydroxymethyltransferase n=1 Tax=Legionella longbeachae serogroup 1 (strain NSW150) TaxID=661367 RepID=D3HPA3_LEGLN|nr:3-methyl-2-oxobutanoate hydroxymethyltransferase [Legionella longbeachae]VEE01242.1 3-methyl-2-oxobutanoate hydroxymethyltransferase [Legionella oakridgensis]HBD7398321.1 3-methyl-2-oxobutanoate hydroxymethyltransferase [Legionella pneumophila]ARB92389.1 3-methyl-2-oxobutanoate hydroxymethyltransferase [Legionella longbeachae]ARM34430.1 3-methyl-2-oxobutanoate hydroxymethyltransferase [Legionella longbeachae]EEZ96282.1 3-methyl-2-oxobutanoate hydroxymethyltransferase [Legionella longbeachae